MRSYKSYSTFLARVRHVCLPVSFFTLMVLPVQAQIITTIAGDGTQAFNGDGGLATSAQFNNPTGLAFDSSGSLYIADQGNARVRKIDPAGTVSTFAGNGVEGYSGDGGAAINAELNYPIGMAVDSAGNVYVSQYGNSVVRKIDGSNTISTVAGNGVFGYNGDGGSATDAWLNYVQGVSTDATGNLYIVDELNQRVRRVSPSKIIETIAGNGVPGFSGDGGSAAAAQLQYPSRIAVDSVGNLYITDPGNHRVRKISVEGVITTVVGNGTSGFSGDGGSAISAQLRLPYGVVVDGAGNLFISDLEDNRIRKVDTNGIITTIAGTGTSGFSGDGGPAISAELNGPIDLAILDSNLYFSDSSNNRIRRVEGVVQSAAVLPKVSIACTPSLLTDSLNQTATCTVTADTALTKPLLIDISPPEANIRFQTDCASRITIAAGQSQVSCTISAISNTIPGDGNVTATISILDNPGLYTVLTRNAAVEVQNDDTPSVAATPVPTIGQSALALLSLVMGWGAIFLRRARMH